MTIRHTLGIQQTYHNRIGANERESSALFCQISEQVAKMPYMVCFLISTVVFLLFHHLSVQIVDHTHLRDGADFCMINRVARMTEKEPKDVTGNDRGPCTFFFFSRPFFKFLSLAHFVDMERFCGDFSCNY